MTATAPSRPLPRSGAATAGLTGTLALLRLAARRDRVLVPASVIALAGFVAGSARATFDLYPDIATASKALAPAFENPALVAMYGPISSLTLDAFATFKSVLLGAVFTCLLAYVVVRRHTRTEEEAGRLELLGAGVVGRRAALAAAVLLGTGAVVLASALTALAARAVGLDAAGSLALGASWLTAGLAWVGVTAVSAQLTSSTRGTAAFSLGALGVAFLVRALGDTAPDGSPLGLVSWLSPLGWTTRIAPYGDNRTWVAALGLAAWAALTGLAFALLERRDLGSGVLPSRPGRARGTLGGVGALTARLARGTVVGWTVAYTVLGVVLGSIASSVEAFVDSPSTAELLRRLGGGTGTIVDTYFATELHIAAVAAGALGIALVSRMHGEEVTGRAEALLATPVRRTSWALAHLATAAAATTFVLLVGGTVAGLVDGRRTGDAGGRVLTLAGSALSTVPAVWVCVAVAMLLVGTVPRLTGLSWAALITFLLLGEFGELLDLPGWLVSLSPFAHLAHLPGGTLEWPPLLALTGVAAVVAGAGLAGLRRRDVVAG